MRMNHEETLLQRAKSKGSILWANFDKKTVTSAQQVTFHEMNGYNCGAAHVMVGPDAKHYTITVGDIAKTVDWVLNGEAPISAEFRDRVAAQMSGKPANITEDVGDAMLQLAAFGEVIYWSHRKLGVDPQSAIMFADNHHRNRE